MFDHPPFGYHLGIGRIQAPAIIYPPLHCPSAKAAYVTSISHNLPHAPEINRQLNSRAYGSAAICLPAARRGRHWKAAYPPSTSMRTCVPPSPADIWHFVQFNQWRERWS